MEKFSHMADRMFSKFLCSTTTLQF